MTKREAGMFLACLVLTPVFVGLAAIFGRRP
jgi:hypothetical protein